MDPNDTSCRQKATIIREIRSFVASLVPGCDPVFFYSPPLGFVGGDALAGWIIFISREKMTNYPVSYGTQHGWNRDLEGTYGQTMSGCQPVEDTFRIPPPMCPPENKYLAGDFFSTTTKASLATGSFHRADPGDRSGRWDLHHRDCSKSMDFEQLIPSILSRRAPIGPVRNALEYRLNGTPDVVYETVKGLSMLPGPPTYGRGIPAITKAATMIAVITAAHTILDQETLNSQIHPLRVYEAVMEIGSRMRIPDEEGLFPPFSQLGSAFQVAFSRPSGAVIHLDHIQYCVNRSNHLAESGRLHGLIDRSLIRAIENLTSSS